MKIRRWALSWMALSGMGVSWMGGLAAGIMVLAPGESAAQFRGGRGDPEAVRHGWLGRLDEGRAAARRTGQPLMVVIRCVP